MQSEEKKLIYDACERLYNLLHGKIPKRIDISDFPDEIEKEFSEVINDLIESFSEVHQFAQALSEGRLNQSLPKARNIFYSPFKQLHAQLMHLTWQTERIAAGDYNQRVDFMGDFSRAFNTMVAKLDDREKALKRTQSELETKVKQRTAELTKANELLNKDIAKRKQVEQELKTANLELESTVRKLEQANRELNHFVSITSHELSESPRQILMFAQQLKYSLEDKLDDEDKENLEFVVSGADRMAHLVAGIRTYSELANSQVLLENVDLKGIVNHLVETDFSAILKETGGTIEVPQPMPNVKASPVQMRLLLQNLIANGIKYRRNQVIPKIVIRAKSTTTGKIRIEVQDNGIGIKEEYHEYIFKIFKRLHLQREYQGIGIGLALCKKILDKHNGEIGVESKYGEGTTFWFTLSPAEELIAV